MLNLNVAPYYDDFDASKNYHKIIFVPGNPVQARELTQIQSMLQNQVKMQGDHIFKNGTMVIPGNVYYDYRVTSIKINGTQNSASVSTFLTSMIDTTVTGGTTDVGAKVIHAMAGLTDSDPSYLFVKYTVGNGTISEFISGETLSNGVNSVTISAASDYSTRASLCRVSEGIFYLNGYFIGVAAQTVLVSADAANTVSATVGLLLNESVITAQDDNSLYDNALGYSNYSAPGADRYKISLELISTSYTSSYDETKFIKLIDIVDGAIAYLRDKTAYSEIEKMLARRTFDESGNFVVTSNVGVKAQHQRTNWMGVWAASAYYIKGDVVSGVTSLGVGKLYYCTDSGFSGSTAPTHAEGTASDGNLSWTQSSAPFLNLGKVRYTDPTESAAMEQQLSVRVTPISAYIQGFEVNSNVSTLMVPKARSIKYKTLTQAVTPGQYVYVTNLTHELNITGISTATIKDYSSATIGSCWVKSIEYDSGTPGATSVYRLYIYGINMNAGKVFIDMAKQIAVGSFTADISPQTVKLSGVVNASSSTTINGKGTRFLSELNVGSRITIGTTTTTVSSITSDFVMVVGTSITATDGSAAKLIANYVDKTNNYIIALPNLRLYTLRDQTNALALTYTISKYIGIGVAAGTTASVSLGSGTETFVNTNNHVVFDNTSNIPAAATFTYSLSNTQMTIGGLVNGHTYSIIAIISRIADSAKEKTKTLKTKTIILDQTKIYDATTLATISSSYNFKSHSFPLTEADLVSITSIKQSGGLPAAPYNSVGEVEISNKYYCADGTTNEFYGMPQMVLSDTSHVPSSPIKATFEYFDHDSGDFFSKNSYDTIPDERTPGMPSSPSDLGSYLDFRSRMDDTGTGFDTGNGASVSSSLYSQSSIIVTYAYYLPRCDILCLNKEGRLIYVMGTSGDFSAATYPATPTGTLLIAKILVPPNTMYPSIEYMVEMQRYKRYTMFDIGRLDDRLSNVERYVSLSLLEKSASDINIKDQNGLARFKNGFVVDSFKNSSVADMTSLDFKADMNNIYQPDVLRPSVFTQYVDMFEADNTTTASRKQNNYAVTGDCASLPYTVVAAISQGVASSAEFINPFDVVVWEGDLQLFPNQDVWEQKSTTNKDVYI